MQIGQVLGIWPLSTNAYFSEGNPEFENLTTTLGILTVLQIEDYFYGKKTHGVIALHAVRELEYAYASKSKLFIYWQ